MSMEQLADAIGVSWQTVQQWENGKTAPKRKRLEDVAEALQTSVDFLVTGGASEGEQGEFVTVRRVGVKFSAGRGSIVFNEDDKSRLSFRADFLRSSGADPSSVVSVLCSGESMAPTIPDGAVVLINMNNKSVSNGKIYAIRHDDQLLIKRLVKTAEGGITAKSDNPEFQDVDLSLPDNGLQIIGRAFWYGAKL